MNRKVFSLLVAGLMLFSVFLVHPVSAANTNKDTLRILYHSSATTLFMGVFNPSPAGMTDIYAVRVWYFLNDPAYVTAPDTNFYPYRCKLVSVQYNVTVPKDAVIWNGTQKKWVSPYAGKTAKSAATWECGLGTWVDGQPITLADFMFDYAMIWEWTYQDGKNDPYYDAQWNTNYADTLSTVMGLKVDKVTSTHITYTIYQDYVSPFGDWSTAINFMEWPSFPWQVYYTVSEMVALDNMGKTVNGKAFQWETTPNNGFQLDMISPDQTPYIVYEAQQLMSQKPIPIWLSTLAPVLKEWKVSEVQAGLGVDQVRVGFEKAIDFMKKYHNALITNGPYFISSYQPAQLYLVMKRANNVRYTYPSTYTLYGKTYVIPTQPFWKEITVSGSTNKNTAITAVAKGDYDIYWYATPMSDFQQAIQQYGNKITLIKSINVWWAIDVNFVGDPQTGLQKVGNSVKFNPFALREVRYALNWLISRSYIVGNILLGSGGPIYGPEVSGQVNAYSAIYTVAKAMGITPQGDEAYAIKLIDDGMNKAAKALASKGYTLEKKNGKWYFNGKPVVINFVIRTEDKRYDEGYYIASVLEKAGFTVNKLNRQRRQANDIVYFSSPDSLQWQLYTEGWVSGGIQPLAWIAWDYWFFDYFVAPSWASGNGNQITVKDFVNNLTNGNLDQFIKVLKLKYYNTPDKLKKLLEWNGYDIDMLLAFNKFKGPNGEIQLVNANQFWDLYKIAYGLHMLRSNRIYTVETWNFFELNRDIKAYITDPISGVSSFLPARGLMPANMPNPTIPKTTTSTKTSTTTKTTKTKTSSMTSTTKTSSSTTTTTSTKTSTTTTKTKTSTTTSTTTTSTTTSSTTTTSTPTSSSSSTSSSTTPSTTSTSSPSQTSSTGGICGPATLVGLALLPLLLRRRK